MKKQPNSLHLPKYLSKHLATYLSNLTFRKKLTFSLIAMALSFPTWAAFTASVNTHKIGVNEQFQLVLSTDEVNGESPDLSPLQKDFEVFGTSQSSQIQIVNGVRSQSKKWVITLSPKQTGTLNIPAITLGTSSSQAIAIEVVSGDTVADTHQGKITVTAKIDDATHYQFQEIPLTVRIETSEPLLEAELIPPTSADIELSQTGSDNNTQMVKGGQQISVIERQYLLRPQKTGEIKLPAFVLRGYLQGKRRDPFADFGGFRDFQDFDRFFDSPFGGSRGESFVAKSKPLTIKVEATPNTQAGEWFLPAKSVELHAQWQPAKPTFKVGEAVTRKIALLALGATPEQLPKLTLGDIEGAKLYIDSDQTASRETAQGTKALREISVSIVPTRAGEVTLPEIQVKWLNTQTNKQEMAILPAQTITVQGAPNAMPADHTSELTAQSTTQSNKTEKANADSTDNAEAVSNQSVPSGNSFAFIVWVIIGAVIGAVAVFMRQKRSSKNHRDNNKVVGSTNWVKNIESALRAQDAKQLYQALLQWQSSGVMFSDALKQHVQQLELQLYHDNTGVVDWTAIRAVVQAQRVQKAPHAHADKALPPLYS